MENKHFSPQFSTKVEEEDGIVIYEPDSPVSSTQEKSVQSHTTIKQLSAEDRPREKLISKGASALTTAELLAILIGGGTKERTAVELMQDVMAECDNRLINLSRMTLEDLMSHKGIGEAKALSIIAAAEIGRRRADEHILDLKQIEDASDVWSYFKSKIQDLTHEQSWVMLLNNNNRLLKCVLISTGGITETAVDTRVIFRHACLAQATGFILIHNHPSGSAHPSRADDNITEKVRQAGKVMSIRMIDHIIVTDSNYYSYAENGKI